MRVLLDECLDWRFARHLPGHDVRSVQEMGWNGITNGELLSLAEKQFDVLLTADRHIPLQQNLSLYNIAIIVLTGRSNRLTDLLPLVPKLLSALEHPASGKVIVVG